MSDHQRSDAEREQEDEVLRQWAADVAAALGVQGLDVDLKLVLGLAGRAAHAVMRPAAPLTTFVAGYAAGLAAASGTDSHEAVSAAVKTTMGLCRERAQAQTAD